MKIKAPVRKDSTLRKSMPRQMPSEDARKLALLAAEAGLEKQALDIEIIDVTGKVDYADFLVIMTGQSSRQVSAIAGEVDERLAKSGTNAISIEGLPKAHWVLIDFVDVVVHVFLDEERALYDLGGLWMDARRVPVPETPPDSGSGAKR